MLKSIALVAAFMATPAAADPDRVSILLGSNHVGATEQFNENNPGVFLTWEDRLDWTIGAYRNSYGKLSVAATVAVPVVTWRDGELSVFAGAALYPGDGRRFAVHAGDVVPVGGLQIRHRDVFAQIIPGDGKFVDAVVSMGLTFELPR